MGQHTQDTQQQSFRTNLVWSRLSIFQVEKENNKLRKKNRCERCYGLLSGPMNQTFLGYRGGLSPNCLLVCVCVQFRLLDWWRRQEVQARQKQKSTSKLRWSGTFGRRRQSFKLQLPRHFDLRIIPPESEEAESSSIMLSTKLALSNGILIFTEFNSILGAVQQGTA